MVGYTYSYLIGGLILLIFWGILFFKRKDTRKEMIVISIIFGFAGLIVDIIHFKDWWVPETIIGTIPAIESFIFGFVVAGIAAVSYVEIFRKRVRIKKVNNIKRDRNLSFILILLAILFFGSFFVFKLHSFYSSIIAFIIPLFVIWIKRKDLIINSIISGILLLITSFFTFIIIELITPGWVNSAWLLNNLSGIIIIKAPLEDLIWFFLAGTFIGPLYEYWQEGKLVNIKKKK